MKLRLQITETIPDDIEEGILYVCFAYWTTAHKCGCGCGQKVVLRLSPNHWAITLNGESVSMYPSVGNWQLPCRSHYWIQEGRVITAEQWSDKEIKRNRVMTKGRRTPFQTHRPRFDVSAQLEDSFVFKARSDTSDAENDSRLDTSESEGISTVSTGRGDDGAKFESTKWWDRAKNSIQRKWRQVVDRIVQSHAS